MAITVDPRVAPYYNVIFILCALVFCHDCKREVAYSSTHPPYTDENYYYDAAVAMHSAGWVVVPNSVDAFCPVCAAKRGLRPTGGAV